MIIESEMKENNDGLKDFLGLTSNVSSFGYKYVVVTMLIGLSKKKIGKLIYCRRAWITSSQCSLMRTTRVRYYPYTDIIRTGDGLINGIKV